jgi:putative SOS response-associated peptidase YedK
MADTGPAISQFVETFTIITTEPNPMVAAVHNRMPVIVGPEHCVSGHLKYWSCSLAA